MSLARLSVRNPVPVNLLMIAVLVLGSISLVALPRELMSDISFNWAFIIKPYPGVSAEQVEKLITVPIEDEIRDLKGIDYISSQSAEGMCFMSVKFKEMPDDEFRVRMQELRAEVAKVTDLPEDALDTQIRAVNSGDMAPLISVHMHGKLGPRRLFALGRQLRDELLVVPGVAKLEMVGVRDREIWVEADPAKLRGYAISLAQLQGAIQSTGVDIPAGKLMAKRDELLVRTVGEFDGAQAIRKVIVRRAPGGGMVRVEDVARVRDTFAEAITRTRLDGDPVVSLTVSKQSDGNSIAITDQIKALAADFRSRHKGVVDVSFTQDSSEQIGDIMSKLTANAWLGFAVVVLLLMLVLGLRNAILAALGIPISFFACFIFMLATDRSFNGNSLFGLVLVLGIIVDDAIIIVENCYRHLQQGKSWREAAIVGTEEVTLPILSATATTIAAFLPLILMTGIMGKFMRIIPITVTLALVASMVEAFIILPSHFAEWPGRRLKVRGERPWMERLRRRYQRVLRFIIGHRKASLGLLFLLIPAAGLLIPLVGVNMFSGEEINTFQVRITMPTGTNLETTSRTLEAFERAARAMPRDEVRAVHATAGLMMTDTDWLYRTDVAQLWLDLPMSYERKRSTAAIMEDLRRRVLRIPGPLSIELAKLNTGPPMGKPVEVKVKGRYLDQLHRAAEAIKAELHKVEGTKDIGDDFRPGKRELRLRVAREKAALYGLSVAQVGGAIRAALDGVKAGRLFDADDEIDIVVRLERDRLRRPEDLLQLPLVLPSGQSIALGDVATFKVASSYAEIRRYRNKRAITVFASVDEAVTTSVAANQALQRRIKDLPRRFPGVTLDFAGEWQEFRESFSSLAMLFLFGMLLIYVILGAQFRSYVQPVVILFTVPFAFVGATVGLLVSGNPFSLVTLFGMVALAGVAVNDAIVLISFANNAREGGTDPVEAVVQAGCLRLRPIILTSLTTIAGLLPMAMGLGGMSLTWGPLANTIVWGLMVGTLLTLFMIPALYLVLTHDIPRRLRRRKTA